MFSQKILSGLSGNPRFEIFNQRDVNDLSGRAKVRTFHKPNREMARVHNRMIGYLQTLRVPTHHSISLRRGQSSFKVIRTHRNNRFFCLFDIKDAFASVDVGRLTEILTGLDPKLDMQDLTCLLEGLFFSPVTGGLATGAPASNMLFDVYCAHTLDSFCDTLSGLWCASYTRYADDLIFSTKDRVLGKRKRAIVREVLSDAGFEVSHHKSEVLDSAKTPIFINGVGVRWQNGCNQFFVPRHFLRKVYSLIHLAKEGRCDPAIVHGRMGLYFQISRTRLDTTSFERKVLSSYRELQRIERVLRES